MIGMIGCRWIKQLIEQFITTADTTAENSNLFFQREKLTVGNIARHGVIWLALDQHLQEQTYAHRRNNRNN